MLLFISASVGNGLADPINIGIPVDLTFTIQLPPCVV